MSMKTAGTLLVAAAALTAGCLSFDGLDGTKESYEDEARAKRDAGEAGADANTAEDAAVPQDSGASDATVTSDASAVQDSGGQDATVPATDAASGDGGADAAAVSDASNVDGGRDASSTLDAAAADGGIYAPTADCTSCTATGTVDGVNNCGPNGNEVCGTSLYVPGGTYYRGDTTNYPATISSFRLDKYEVTVGRFRKFVDAWVGGWRPAAGSGKHTHLNGGQGLANTAGGYEAGWDSAWSSYVGALPYADAVPTTPGATTVEAWNRSMSDCGSTMATWTSSPSASEKRPQNCLSWYSLYAFCVWDGGFLPSEAEWEYAAAGGAEERMYPWGAAAPSATLASFNATTAANVGASPSGSSRWGQNDVAGNVLEWTRDINQGSLVLPCLDCSALAGNRHRVVRGGAFGDPSTALVTTSRDLLYAAAGATPFSGGRCARVP